MNQTACKGRQARQYVTPPDPRRATRRLRTVALLLLYLSGGAGHIHAAGFALFEHSAKNLGSAYAGGGTNAGREPSTIFWNPAGMTLVEGRQAQAGVTYLTVEAQFNDRGSSQTLFTPGGPVNRPSTGREDDAGTDAFVPNLYFKSDLGDRLSAGVGIFSPYGLRTKYDADWIGRYHAVKSELKNVNINPSLAYRVTDRLSAGLGVSASYVDTELTSAVFLLDPATGGQLPDGRVKIKGDDWSYGFNLGLLYAFDPGARLGISYRSKVEHGISGNRILSGVGPLSGSVGAGTNLTLPETLLFSGYLPMNKQWSLLADVIWTRWSRFDELRISFDDGSPDDVTVNDWQDSWRFTVGAEYRHDARWSFRTGLALDQSPIPDARHRNPRIPGNDRRWIAVGASYRPSDAVSIDFAYTHLFISDAEVDNTIDLAPSVFPGAFTDRLVGTYENAADVLALEVSVAF